MSPGTIMVADEDRAGVRRKTGNGDWEVRQPDGSWKLQIRADGKLTPQEAGQLGGLRKNGKRTAEEARAIVMARRNLAKFDAAIGEPAAAQPDPEVDQEWMATAHRVADRMDRILRPEPEAPALEPMPTRGPLPPLLEVILDWLLEHGETWTHADRIRWDSAFSAIVQLLYPT